MVLDIVFRCPIDPIIKLKFNNIKLEENFRVLI